MIAQLPTEMSDLTIDLDGNGSMDVSQIDIPFLMHGFYPLEADEAKPGHGHYDVNISLSFEDVTENGMVGRTDSLHPLTGVNRSPRRHPEIPIESGIFIDVAGLSAEQLTGATAVVTLVYPESTTEYTYPIDLPTGNIIPLRLPPHYSGVPDADSTPACNRDKDYNVFVAVQLIVPSIGHEGLARFDNCEFTTAVRAAAGGTPAIGLAFTFDPSGQPPPPATGETLIVTKTDDTADGTCGPSDCSLREALIFANPVPGFDTILVPAGTYKLTRTGQNENDSLLGDLDIHDDVAIIGEGAETTIIDGIQADRVFHTFPNIQVVFEGLRITGGRALNAGGIAIAASEVTFRDSVVTGNAATSQSFDPDRGGGGIYNTAGTLNLENTTVSNNTAGSAGGGIHVQGPHAVTHISGSTIDGNTVRDGGGGIYAVNGGVLTLDNSVVSNNIGSAQGGGIMARDIVVIISDSTFSDNIGGDASLASGRGGGIYADTSDVTIERSSFDGNDSGAGGGIGFADGPRLIIRDSTISSNIASGGGGIFFVVGLTARNNGLDEARFLITDSTVSNNGAAGTGGGIDFDAAEVVTTAVIENSVISGNTAVWGGGISGAILGSLTIKETELSNNVATFANPHGVPGVGGGGVSIIVTEGFSLETSLVSGNSAPLTGGGGIFVAAAFPSFVNITNTTFSGNSAGQGGGAIFTAPLTGIRVNNSTFSGNTSDFPGDVAYLAAISSVIVFKGTIIDSPEGNTACAGAGTPVSFGYNIGSEDTCGLTVSTDQPNTDALLEPLQNLGGPTSVHSLSPDSPALNALPVIDCNTIGAAPIPIQHDQRRAPRPEQPGSLCDIGAYEDNVLPFIDIDGDGVPRSGDNCSLRANIDQADDDGDGIGNPCEPGNVAPNADAGGPYSVDEGSTVALDGTGSSDSDGTISKYEWDLDGDTIFGETGGDAANGDEVGPTPDFDAADLDGLDSVEISLRVTDNGGTPSTATSTVTIVNVAPTVGATGDSVNVDEIATVAATFTDPGSADTHTATIDWDDGTAIEDLGPVTSPFSPTPTHVYKSAGIYTVTITVTDDDGGDGVAQVEVKVAEVIGNTAPVAENDDYATDEGVQLNVPSPGILDNDSDDDEDSLSAVSITGPLNDTSGSLNVNSVGSFTYTPGTDFFGTATFTYRADDGTDLSEPATVTIQVSEFVPGNVVPTANAGGPYSVDEGSTELWRDRWRRGQRR